MSRAYRFILHNSLLFILFSAPSLVWPQQTAAKPGTRSIMDAHNCYPYFEWWFDRIDRALSTGTPLAIEQDLYWYTGKRSGRSLPVVTHGPPATGQEPTMEKYFFERIRPIVEDAIRRDDRSQWPILTLNLDFKTEEPEHLAAVRKLLEKYQDWITSAPRTRDESIVQPLNVRPVLVLTGESDSQQSVFYDDVPIGGRLLAFGAVHSHMQDPSAAPEILEPDPASNYRRWWNNPWSVVEKDGQSHAGAWTSQSDRRLAALVHHAHAHGLWIRFYTLDGAGQEARSAHGWFHDYDFGTLPAAEARWKAAYLAGADYIASDQYEDLSRFLMALRHAP